MPRKSPAKPRTGKAKLTDAERLKRFKEMGKEVGASEDPKAFEKAFKKVASQPPGRK